MKGRDYLAVLSLDGTLAIFEQETHTFSRFLPGLLVPGPLSYVARSDSFVVAASSYSLESFKYQALATAGDPGGREGQDLSSGRRIAADWRFEVGEAVLQLQVGIVTVDTVDISGDICVRLSAAWTRMTRPRWWCWPGRRSSPCWTPAVCSGPSGWSSPPGE